jgi:ubiquinone/menaquinone biosynthesis C-methylase UbiE
MTEQERRFRDTAGDYQQYRLDYPLRLIVRLAGLVGLKPGDAVLDLGCGPGNLAIPLARMGMVVTAMDPEPDMLAAAREAAGDLPIRFVQGGSGDLSESDGPFRLVTIGRAFHFMDRAATLDALDRIVTQDGGIALLHDAHPPVPENDWYKTLLRISDRHGRAVFAKDAAKGGHRRYETALYASAFTQLDGLSVTIRSTVTADQIVGRAFTTSLCSRALLGAGGAAFEAELRTALREIAPDGSFTEIAELVALLARRPGQT